MGKCYIHCATYNSRLSDNNIYKYFYNTVCDLWTKIKIYCIMFPQHPFQVLFNLLSACTRIDISDFPKFICRNQCVIKTYF